MTEELAVAAGNRQDVKPHESESQEKDPGKDPSDVLTSDHPRFKEIYGKMKAFEKSLADKDADIESLRQHNAQLNDAVQKTIKQNNKPDPPPDPAIDPEGFAKYWENREANLKNELENKRVADRLALQIETQKDMHDDYEQVVKSMMTDMKKDPALKEKIWKSANPAKEAYKIGKERMLEQQEKEKTEEEKKIAKEKAGVEGGSPPKPPPDKKRQLTAEQKLIVKNLGITEERYIFQLDAIEKSRRTK